MAVFKTDQENLVYKCDAPDCRSGGRFTKQGIPPEGTNGTAQRHVTRGANVVDVVADFYACKDPHIGKAIKAVLDAEEARLVGIDQRQATMKAGDIEKASSPLRGSINVTKQVDTMTVNAADPDEAERELARAAREDDGE